MHFFTDSRLGIAVCALVVLGVSVLSPPTGPGGGAGTVLVAVMVVQAVALAGWGRAAVGVWVLCLCGYALVGIAGEWAGGAGNMCLLALLNLALRRAGKQLVVAAVVTFLVVFAVVVSYEPPGAWPGIGFTMVAWTIGAAGFGVAVRARQEQVAAAEERARRAVATREAEAQRRVTEERLRIARDLHDVLGHHVAVIRLHTGLARRSVRRDPDRAETALREAESAGQAVLRELAGMLQVLREPGQADAAGPAPGLADLDPLVATLRSGGMEIEVHREGDAARVPGLVGVTAYRVVQELLTNARRHGGGAVTLSVRVTADAVVIRTANPVLPGPPAAAPGFGLVGMRERVRAAGGSLSVSGPAEVFEVVAQLPLGKDGT